MLALEVAVSEEPEPVPDPLALVPDELVVEIMTVVELPTETTILVALALVEFP